MEKNNNSDIAKEVVLQFEQRFGPKLDAIIAHEERIAYMEDKIYGSDHAPGLCIRVQDLEKNQHMFLAIGSGAFTMLVAWCSGIGSTLLKFFGGG